MREKIIEYIITLLFMALIVGCIYALYAFCIRYNLTLVDLICMGVVFFMFILMVMALHEFLDDLNVFTVMKSFMRKKN